MTSEPQTSRGLDKAIGEAITSLAKGFDNELFALSQDDLASQWYFAWDDRCGMAWNLYRFSDMLEMHKRRCRRWEEHHNGHECVVERVRDKYLMPRVKSFLVELSERSAESHG